MGVVRLETEARLRWGRSGDCRSRPKCGASRERVQGTQHAGGPAWSPWVAFRDGQAGVGTGWELEACASRATTRFDPGRVAPRDDLGHLNPMVNVPMVESVLVQDGLLGVARCLPRCPRSGIAAVPDRNH